MVALNVNHPNNMIKNDHLKQSRTPEKKVWILALHQYPLQQKIILMPNIRTKETIDRRTATAVKEIEREIEVEIGTGAERETEVEKEIGVETEIEVGTETETGIETEIEIRNGIETGIEEEETGKIVETLIEIKPKEDLEKEVGTEEEMVLETNMQDALGVAHLLTMIDEWKVDTEMEAIVWIAIDLHPEVIGDVKVPPTTGIMMAPHLLVNTMDLDVKCTDIPTICVMDQEDHLSWEEVDVVMKEIVGDIGKGIENLKETGVDKEIGDKTQPLVS